MALPNLSENKENIETEKTLGDINSNIFDIQIEVEDGFKSLIKSLDLSFDIMHIQLDIISDSLHSIEDTLFDSFKLSQTQQQEKQIALQKAKVEDKPKDKEKVVDKNLPTVNNLVEGFGLMAIAIGGFAVGALVSFVRQYFFEKLIIAFRLFGKKFDTVGDFADFLSDFVKSIGTKTLSLGKKIVDLLKSALSFTGRAILNIIDLIVFPFRLFAENAGLIKAEETAISLGDEISKFATRIGDFFGNFKLSKITEVFTRGSLTEAFTNFFAEANKFIGDLFKSSGLEKLLGGSGGFTKSFSRIFGILEFFLSTFGAAVRLGFTLTSNLLKVFRLPFVSTIVDFAVGVYKGFQKDLTFFGALFEGVKEVIAGGFGALVDIAFDITDFLLNKFFGIKDFKKIFFGTLGLDENLSLADQVKNAVQDVVDYVSGLFTGTVNIFDDIFAVVDGFAITAMETLDDLAPTGTFIRQILDILGSTVKLVFFKLFAAFNFVSGFFENFDEDLGIIERLKNGVTKALGGFGESILGFVNDIVKLFSPDGMYKLVFSGAKALGAPGFILDFLKDKLPKTPTPTGTGTKLEKDGKEVGTTVLMKDLGKALRSNDFDKSKNIISQLQDSGKVSDERIKMLQQRLLTQQSRFGKQSEALASAQSKNDKVKQEEKQISQNNTNNTAIDQSKRTTTNVVQKMENSDPLVGKGYSIVPMNM